MLEKNKTNFCTFIFFSLQTLRKSRMFVQCEMLIYVKCLWCHVKHPVRLREINVTKTFLSRWWDRSKFKDHMKKQTFIVKVTKALFSLLLRKQGKRASCYSDMSQSLGCSARGCFLFCFLQIIFLYFPLQWCSYGRFFESLCFTFLLPRQPQCTSPEILIFFPLRQYWPSMSELSLLFHGVSMFQKPFNTYNKSLICYVSLQSNISKMITCNPLQLDGVSECMWCECVVQTLQTKLLLLRTFFLVELYPIIKIELH